MFEAMLAQAQAEHGFIPQSAADEIKEKRLLRISIFEEMNRIYQKIGHGFVPF